ncbi:MAG: LacI family transcriptional regulator [Spirochaetaceae bacterium]|nr:LacI family transcriptional regulator [Spirochaetaceae bacterium]
MLSIKDIARQVGTSPSTVSRVVNGKAHVNSKKREQILKLIKETGYVPNKAARSMVLQRSFAVGIVVPDTFNLFQQELFSIIERRLESLGYHTLFFFTKLGLSNEEDCLRRLSMEKLDGVIILQEMHLPGFFEYFSRTALPVVASTCKYHEYPTVGVNEKQAAFEGVNYLISLGHKKINMISGIGFAFGTRRTEGYYEALTFNGITPDESRVSSVQYYTAEFGMYGMSEMLQKSRDFTALFTANDELAIGAIRVLRDEGIRVPEDVSVLGFDDIYMSNYIVPRLTTIRQPINEIGEQAALALHQNITGVPGSAGFDIELPHRLVIRESTAPLSPSTTKAAGVYKEIPC